MGRAYYVIDAFATEPFTGNPAAVVLDAQGLDDPAMQRIAAEFNLSETTFVLPVNEAEDAAAAESVRFRWFTPTVEVDMCGHATVAGVFALVQAGRLAMPDSGESTIVRIHTRAGTLTGFVEPIPGDSRRLMIWLEMIPPQIGECAVAADALAEALGLSPGDLDRELPPAATQDHDVLLFAKSFMAVNAARPDFPKLAALFRRFGLRGVCLATTHTVTPSLHVQSRFFAPTAGVDEDPVTGSVHGPLAAYLVEHGRAPADGDTAALNCGQAKPGGRGGLLHALVRTRPDGGRSVRIGGRAFTVMRGELLP